MKTKSRSRSASAESIRKGEVVCATDFSIHAARAAEAAAAIAKRLDVPLRLVHVVECTSFPKRNREGAVTMATVGTKTFG